MQTRYIIQSKRTLRTALRVLRSLAPLTALVTLACARGEPQALGYTSDSLESSGDDSDVTPRSFFGSWVGAAEDALALAYDPDVYQFPSGSTQIRLNIIDYSFASITFGDGELPTGPIDPNLSYPPGLTLESYEPNPAPLEGFEYTLSVSRFLSEIAPEHFVSSRGFEDGPNTSLAEADGILRFLYSTRQALAPWCAEQRPHEDGHGGYNCLGAVGVDQATDGLCYTFDSEADFYPLGSSTPGRSGIIPEPSRQVDCTRAFQCFDQCLCPSPGIDGDETGCFSNDTVVGELWLRKTSEGLVGVFAGDAVFENARGARTSLGRVRFVPAED